jgi:hypothetical protein
MLRERCGSVPRFARLAQPEGERGRLAETGEGPGERRPGSVVEQDHDPYGNSVASARCVERL